MRLRSPLLIALALAAPMTVQAQQTHADSTRPHLDTVGTSLTRFCNTKTSNSFKYLCAIRDNVLAVRKADSLSRPRVDTVLVTRVDTVLVSQQGTPKDTTTKPDTTTPPDTATKPDTAPTPSPAPPVQWSHPFPPPANGAVLAELPRDTVDGSYPAITRRYACTALQTCLDTAKTGDEILLAPGAVHRNAIVRATARGGAVVVRTNVELGGPWERMTPTKADALSLATITTSTSEPAIVYGTGAHHVRFTGVRVTSTGPAAAIVRASNGETTVSATPHHLTLDRVVVDGGSSDLGRCVHFDGGDMAVLYSSLVNCHSKVRDAQAFLAGNGAGPYRLEGNLMDGSGQCFMFGGYDSRSEALIPSDIVVRNNVCTKPLSWRTTTPGTYGPGQWQVKTIVESKNARRVLVEGNVIENVWKDAQDGFAFLLKSVNQDGTAPWSFTGDWTIRYNRIRNVANGINISPAPTGPAVPATRFTIYGNVVEPFPAGAEGRGVMLGTGLTDIVLAHNTFGSMGNAALTIAGTGTIARLAMRSNVLPPGAYGVKGDSRGIGLSSITAYLPGSLWETNLMPGADVYPLACSLFPAGTLCPATVPAPLPIGIDGLAIGYDPSKVAP